MSLHPFFCFAKLMEERMSVWILYLNKLGFKVTAHFCFYYCGKSNTWSQDWQQQQCTIPDLELQPLPNPQMSDNPELRKHTHTLYMYPVHYMGVCLMSAHNAWKLFRKSGVYRTSHSNSYSYPAYYFHNKVLRCVCI